MKIKKITGKILLLLILSIFLTSCGLLTDPEDEETNVEVPLDISLSNMTLPEIPKEEGKAGISSFTIPPDLKGNGITATVEFDSSDDSILKQIKAIQASLSSELNKHLPETIEKTTLDNFNVQIKKESVVIIKLKPKHGYKFTESVNPNNDGSVEISVSLTGNFAYHFQPYNVGSKIVFNNTISLGNGIEGYLEIPTSEKITIVTAGSSDLDATAIYNVTFYKGDRESATAPQKADLVELLQQNLQNNATLNGFDTKGATVSDDSSFYTVSDNDTFDITGIYFIEDGTKKIAPNIALTLNVTTKENNIIQEKFKLEWMENTKNINVDNRYFGDVDIWGGGKVEMDLWFQDGNLWDEFHSWGGGEYVLHKLLTDPENKTLNKATFIDGNTALMFIPSSASGTIAYYGVFYIVRVKDNKIYRTKSAWGWGGDVREDAINLKDWDGSIPEKALSVGDQYYNLVVIGNK